MLKGSNGLLGMVKRLIFRWISDCMKVLCVVSFKGR